VLAGISYPRVADALGRRAALLWAAIITIIFTIVQACSVNIAMFTVARVFVGYGNAAGTIAAPTYLAETLPYKWRGWGLALINDFYYVGMLTDHKNGMMWTNRLDRRPDCCRHHIWHSQHSVDLVMEDTLRLPAFI
jgi:hypothetical protein